MSFPYRESTTNQTHKKVIEYDDFSVGDHTEGVVITTASKMAAGSQGDDTTTTTAGVTTPVSTPRKLKFEQLRADYELFLQTFEKPTWMYRLLQRRAQVSPFMLHRNLSYIRGGAKTCKNKKKQQDKRKVREYVGVCVCL